MHLPSKIPRYHQKSHREANYPKSSRESNKRKTSYGVALQKAYPRHLSRSMSTSSANPVQKPRRTPLSQLLAAEESHSPGTSSTKSMSTRQLIHQKNMSSLTMNSNKQMVYQEDHQHHCSQSSPSPDSIRSSLSPGYHNQLRRSSTAGHSHFINSSASDQSINSRRSSPIDGRSQMQYFNPAAILNPLFDLEGVQNEPYNSLNMHYQAVDRRQESQTIWQKWAPQTAFPENHSYGHPVLTNSEAIANDKSSTPSICNQRTVMSGYGDHVKKTRSSKHNEKEDTVNTEKIMFGETLLDSVTHDILKRLCTVSPSFSPTTIGSVKALFKRILVLRTHALATHYGQISSDGKKMRALATQNGQISLDKKERSAFCSNSGDNKQRSLLEMQKCFFDEGMKAFDALMESRHRLQEAMVSFDDTKVFKVACFGGGSGSSAMAVRLFHLLEKPSMEIEVDICADEHYYEDIVKKMSLNDIAYRETNLMQMVKGGLENYQMVFIVVQENSEFRNLGQNSTWDSFYEVAPIGTIVLLVAIDQPFSQRKWEHIAPSTSLWTFHSPCHINSCIRMGVK